MKMLPVVPLLATLTACSSQTVGSGLVGGGIGMVGTGVTTGLVAELKSEGNKVDHAATASLIVGGVALLLLGAVVSIQQPKPVVDDPIGDKLKRVTREVEALKRLRQRREERERKEKIQQKQRNEAPPEEPLEPIGPAATSSSSGSQPW